MTGTPWRESPDLGTLVGAGTASQYYEYDRDGARRDDYNATFTNVNGFEYDGAGRMVGYTHNLNTAPNSCSYDPDGRMYQGCGGAPFSLLGHDAIRAPQLGWFYVYAPGLDEPLVAIKRVGDTKLAQARLSLVSDGMGQLVSIADSAGTYNNVYENPSTYASGTWATSGITQRAQTFDPRRLATDTTSAISSFRTRQYDPATGSWLQEDHAGLAGGTNLYEYNGNDPNSFRDPVGLAACEDPSGKPRACQVTISPEGRVLGASLAGLRRSTLAHLQAVADAADVDLGLNATTNGHHLSSAHAQGLAADIGWINGRDIGNGRHTNPGMGAIAGRVQAVANSLGGLRAVGGDLGPAGKYENGRGPLPIVNNPLRAEHMNHIHLAWP